MSTQRKEKGLQKYSFRGNTPDQLNELNQEQLVELFRARQRRRFARSISLMIQKSNISITGFTLSVRKLKRTLNLVKNQHQLKLI